jgi:hypothetical protein
VTDNAEPGAPWVMAAIRAEQTADPTFFAVMLRATPTINRRERCLIAQVIEQFPRVHMDQVGDVHCDGYGVTPTPAMWKSIGAALYAGNAGPLITELRSDRQFDPADLSALATLLWRMRMVRGQGRPAPMLAVTADTLLALAAGDARRRQKNGVGRAEAIAQAVAGTSISVQTLANFMDGRRGSTQRKRRKR